MRISAGLSLAGTTLTPFDDRALGRGAIGEAVWGPGQLLRDLELRLGIGVETEPNAVRVAIWSARMALLAPLGRFYSQSFQADPLATARAVLTLRDELVDAGWSGEPIPEGGPRLDAIQELEAWGTPQLPAGLADRVAAVGRALEGCQTCFYEEVWLAEAKELWSTRWQAVFHALEQTGTGLCRIPIELPGAPRDTDLGRVQAALKPGTPAAPAAFAGDGSFLLLTAETSWEAARATAALLAGFPSDRTVVIRDRDVSALDHALATHGLSTQGRRSLSPWRAALQVLPLALELAFEPKDPYRVLELLTLPVGPFQGLSGHVLAGALAESPGIGSPAWTRAKTWLTERLSSPDLATSIGEWVEQHGAESSAGASKADLLRVVARVRAWIVSRIASAPDDPVLLAAAGHTATLSAALERDPRPALDLVEVRRLAETVLASGTSVKLEEERAGRIDHVASACAILVPREVIVWWFFAGDESGRPTLRWRRRELSALANAGIGFPDPRAHLAERAGGWRRAILAATLRVLLVVPRSHAGAPLAAHPLWDEIVARTGAEEALLARIEVPLAALLLPASRTPLPDAPPLASLAPLPLPGGHLAWTVGEDDLPAPESVSATSLQALLGCPLQWALHYGAGVRSGGHALPSAFMLNGQLGHRLVELLHAEGAFNEPDTQIEARAASLLDELFLHEGAVLLRAGMGIERAQLRSQLLRAVLALARVLRAAGLRIAAVETPIDVSWHDRRLNGRIDLLVATDSGAQAIIDIKWGISDYRHRLRSGQALQLALYAFTHAAERGDRAFPDAAYFSLKEGRLLSLPSRRWRDPETIDGPSLDDTWKRLERSVAEAERVVRLGRLPVTGLRRSPPLLGALGVPETAWSDHLLLGAETACRYCDCDALCGRRWEIAE